MEDAPEVAEGNYPYRGKVYRLVEGESERWSVFDGDIYLGVLVAEASADRPDALYTLDFAGEEGEYDEPATDDWRLVLEYLIDNAPEAQADEPGHNEPDGTPPG
jgi:hypothetical protein